MKFSTTAPCKFAVLLTVFFLLMIPDGRSQETDLFQNRPFNYEASILFTGTGSETPFWHYANTNGQIQSGSSFNNIAGLAVAMPFRDNASGLDLSAGAELTSRLSDTGNTIHFQQLYGSLKFGVIQLNFGRFYGTIGLNPADLSTGSMIQSNNATPIPKISLDMTRFVDVPLTNGILQFKGHYSDGKLESDRFVDSPFIHQKSFYLKINIERLEAIGGFVHNVQWGGTHPELGKLPQSFGDYLRVVFGQFAEADSNAPEQDLTNNIGNTVAAYDVALRYSLKSFQLQGYRMFYLEDSVSTRFRSFWDGLYGLGFRRIDGVISLLTGLNYEFMNTIQQDSPSGVPRGRASYYNHNVYRSGWSSHGNVLGNPLIRFNNDTDRIDNNMIIAHNLGMDGWITSRLQYRALATYSRNYGVCSDQIITGRCQISSKDPDPPEVVTIPRGELRRDQYSALLETNFLLDQKRGIRLHSSVALDTGEFLGDRTGVLIGISWNGRL